MRTDVAALAGEFSMRWTMTRAAKLKRMAIFASKTDHVLQELLWRVHSDELNTDIRMVISNHPDLAETVESWGIPFHHVPVSKKAMDEAIVYRNKTIVFA